MKLPPRDDPHGDKEGELPREIVLVVLEENDIEVTSLGNNLYELYVVVAGEAELEVQRFDHIVGGILIRRLSQDFDIPLVNFYYDPISHTQRYPKQ